MATFGQDIYGSVAYGRRDIRAFAASPVARCLYYDQVEVEWTAPVGIWSRLRLVRNPNGEPFGPDDGSVVVDVNPGGASTYIDTDVVPGRRYYYGVFVLDAQNVWKPAGVADVLVTRDNGSLATLWNRLPQIYKLDDFSELTSQDDTGAPMLIRFLSLFAYELDAARTEYDGLLDLTDPAKTPTSALPALLAQYDLDVEPALGSRAMRQLAANAPYLYATKGTAASLENLVTILTGWDCYYRTGINRVLDEADALISPSIGRWGTAKGNCSVFGRANKASGISGPIGTGYMVMLPSADGEAWVSTSAPGDTGRLNSINVVPSRFYYGFVSMRGTGTAYMGVDFYGNKGQLLGSVDGNPVTADVDTFNSVIGITAVAAPPNSVYAALRIVIPNATAGEALYFNGLQFGPQPGEWEPPRQAQLVVRADRVNEIYNPASRAVSSRGWFGGTIYTGDPGLVFQWNGDPQVDETDRRSIYAEPRVVVQPGEQWSMTVRARTDDENVDFCPHLKLYSGEIAVGNAHLENTDYVSLDTDWRTVTFTWRVPSDGSVTSVQAGLAMTRLDVNGDPLDETNRVEFADVGLFRGADAQFFDGSYQAATADFLWEGTPFYSRSHLYSLRSVKDQRARALLKKFVPAGMDAILVYAQSTTGVYAQHKGLENFNRNPGLAPRVHLTFDFTVVWRRPYTWDELAADYATWDDVRTAYVNWDDVVDD